MPAIEESIVIDRPREEVFDFLTEPSNTPRFDSAMIEVEKLDERIEKGARVRAVIRVAGRSIESISEVVEHHRPDRFAFRSVESPVDFEVRWTLTDLGEGATRVDFRNEAPNLKGFWGKLADPVVRRMYAHDVRASLENLKELLENA